MERDVSCGADPGTSSGASGGPGDEKDEDIDNSHGINEPEDEEYPELEADTLSHSSAYTSREGDSYSDESAMEEELSDSDSEGATSVPRTSPQGAKDSGRNRKNSNHFSYSDLSYLNRLSRRKRRRIEGEIIKGCKLGECNKICYTTIDHVL
jgi:hypothetical protein